MKKKYNPSFRVCKVRIDLKKFESIKMTFDRYGFPTFQHCLN